MKQCGHDILCRDSKMSQSDAPYIRIRPAYASNIKATSYSSFSVTHLAAKGYVVTSSSAESLSPEITKLDVSREPEPQTGNLSMGLLPEEKIYCPFTFSTIDKTAGFLGC